MNFIVKILNNTKINNYISMGTQLHKMVSPRSIYKMSKI